MAIKFYSVFPFNFRRILPVLESFIKGKLIKIFFKRSSSLYPYKINTYEAPGTFVPITIYSLVIKINNKNLYKSFIVIIRL